MDNSEEAIWKVINDAIENIPINLAKYTMKMQDMITIVENMGLKITNL